MTEKKEADNFHPVPLGHADDVITIRYPLLASTIHSSRFIDCEQERTLRDEVERRDVGSIYTSMYLSSS